MKEEDQEPNITQNHATHFGHGKGPWDSRNAGTEKNGTLDYKKSMYLNITLFNKKLPLLVTLKLFL